MKSNSRFFRFLRDKGAPYRRDSSHLSTRGGNRGVPRSFPGTLDCSRYRQMQVNAVSDSQPFGCKANPFFTRALTSQAIFELQPQGSDGNNIPQMSYIVKSICVNRRNDPGNRGTSCVAISAPNGGLTLYPVLDPRIAQFRRASGQHFLRWPPEPRPA